MFTQVSQSSQEPCESTAKSEVQVNLRRKSRCTVTIYMFGRKSKIFAAVLFLQLKVNTIANLATIYCSIVSIILAES